MATADNGKLIRDMYAAWNLKDFERVASFAAPGAQMLNVPFGVTVSTSDYARNWATAFSDGKVEVVNLVSQGDIVVAECIGRGTHTGPLASPLGAIAPTRRTAEFKFVEIYNLSAGKITGGRIYFDSASLLRQLGLGPEMPLPVGKAAPQPEVRH